MTWLSEHQLYLLSVPGPACLGPRIDLPAYRHTQAKVIDNLDRAHFYMIIQYFYMIILSEHANTHFCMIKINV